MNKSTFEINTSKDSYTEPSRAEVLAIMISEAALYMTDCSLSVGEREEIAQDIAKLAKEVSELEPEDLSSTYHLSFDDWCDENSEAIDDIYDRYVAESDDITREELEKLTFKTENKDATVYREIVWSIPLVC